MATREQKNFEYFKIFLDETISKEEKKLGQLSIVKKMVNDKELHVYIAKREKFLIYSKDCSTKVKNAPNYQDNPKANDTFQKEFYLTLDSLKKEALKLMATHQKLWFNTFFYSNFEMLKMLLRSLIISESQNDIATIERIIQEIELIRFKGGI